MQSKLPINLPPDPYPRKPRLVAPPGSWDTHFHVWGPPHLFPYAESRRYTPPAAPVEHYLAIASAIGIERGVMVQPSIHGTETAVTVDAIAKSDGRLRGMIRADPDLSEAEVKKLHAAGVRGLRFNFASALGGAFDEGQFHRIVSRIESASWVVDLQIDYNIIVERAELIRRVPLPVVIDCFGRVDPRKGLDQPALRTLLDLIGEPHVWVKIHGADRFMSRGVRFEDIVLMARALIAKAPDHVIWGTDWPHSGVFEPNRMPNDGDLIDMLLDFAPDETVRNKILVDNPALLFDFD